MGILMMKEVVSVLAVLVVTVVRCSELGKDVNFYKDYLRARSDEAMLEDSSPERMLYFYRTPLQLYPGLLPAIEQEYRKRTGNVFKNHMLNKDLQEDSPGKRSSKTALSLMLQGKQAPYANVGNICPFGK